MNKAALKRMTRRTEFWIFIVLIIMCLLIQFISGGNQQKIVLSKWLCNDLDVLILNGPTVGVDIGAKQDIHHLVHELANEGLAVIIISDDLSEVVINCSRVLVMKDGEIVGEMTDERITEENILEIIR